MTNSIEILQDYGKNCISISGGQRLYERIYPLLKNNEKIVLNFKGVDILATPFLNSAFGQLLKDLNRSNILNLIEFRNKPMDFDKTLIKVMNNAEIFYSDPNNKARLEDVIKRNLDSEN